MPRGIRNTAVEKIPEKVEFATHVPIIVIPSAGQSRLAEGTEIVTGPQGRQRHQEVERRTPTNSKRETEVRVRFQPCCGTHKGAIEEEGLKALINSAQLLAMSNRFTQHHGHGALKPANAWIDWDPCREKVLCHDCIVEQCDELGIRTWYGNKDDGRQQYTDGQLLELIQDARKAAQVAA